MEKTRYSDNELQEFKEIILKKLATAREEFSTLQKSLKDGNENGTDSTNNSTGYVGATGLNNVVIRNSDSTGIYTLTYMA
ncbi:MAG: hypothetical protein EBV15_04175, partial [Bacteroidetes bacterium]|nr:hypothetical protein [Bacteroidota bacterium]